MLFKLFLVVLFAVEPIFQQGFLVDCFCHEETTCPLALYPDGMVVRSIPTISIASMVNTSYPVNCHTSNACYKNPCKNGGTCMEDRVGSHRCRCLLGYDGRTCDSLVQILINTLDQKRVIFANVTDLSFSSLYSFDNVTIEYLAYDSNGETLYFSSEIGYELFEIRVAVGYNESRIVFGDLEYLDEIVIYAKERILYFVEGTWLKWIKLQYLQSHSENYAELKSFKIPFYPIRMFVIDEEREFMYFISRLEIYRTNMEGSGYIVITEMELPLHAINGFTIDQDQRLYFASTIFNGDIYTYDLKRGNGVNLLGHFRKMGATSLVYTSGWLLWRDWRMLRICLTPLFEEEGGKGNTTCKPTQPMNKEDIRNIHQDSQKGMVLRKVKMV